MNRQAILIMYHRDYYVLDKLLNEIDSRYFDVYLHIDKKVKKEEYKKIKKQFSKENIYFVKRTNVKWSTYSQINCELLLLEESTKKQYQYYHLISGNDLLIDTSSNIFNFFSDKTEEFIGYMNFNSISDECLERIKYFHILNGNRRHSNRLIKNISNKVYYHSLNIQKKLKINRLKNNTMDIRKGANWFSITHDFAKYVLSQKQLIKRIFKYSNCADELFLQTIAYNSPFKEKIFNQYNDEHRNIFRFIDWHRGEPYVFKISDYEEIMQSNCFFARKFSSQVDKEIVDKIYNTIIRR